MEAVIDPKELRFEREETGRLFHALLESATTFCQGWKHRPFTRGGNFISGRWATGAGAGEDCQIAGGSAHRRDQRAVELSTLFHPRAPFQAFGLNFTLLQVPPDSGWGLSLSLHLEGKSVMGEGLSLSFRRYAPGGGRPVERLDLGRSLGHDCFEATIGYTDARPHLEILADWLRSPSSLAEQASRSLDGLEQEFRRALEAGEIEGADEGPYMNDGIPPERSPRPLTTEERERARADATGAFEGRRQLIGREASRFHGLLVEAFPLGDVPGL